ncbi:MAG TPA: choice-of-anchor D domain-containing protein [Candidatus Acidoferrum sp.]|nr:choice-of-anchor D domain-containing protein [Candidatus Acidoferrum sp.]
MKSLKARLAFLLEVFRSLSLIAFASATLMLIAPATLVAQTNGSLVTSRIIQSIDENARITLKGNVRKDLATAPDFGSVEDGKPLHLYLLLQRTTAQQADLDNLIARQQQPTAPEYHKWLAPKKFGARFGASPEDIAKITAWLESHGFQVRSVLNNASTIDFAATAGQVRDTFHTELHYFNIRGGKYLANVKDPQIPAALAPVVAGIKGLIKIPAHTNHTPIRQASYDAHTHRWHTVDSAGKAGAKPAFDDAADGDLDVTPQDFYTIYNVNPVFTSGHLAATATVAVIEESDMEYGTVNSSTDVATGGDVATFRTLFGVPGTLNMHVYHGYGTVTCNDPGIDPDGTGEDEEASLDAEWINATAPSANLIFMSCDQSPDNGIFSSMAALVDNSLSDVMSLSYGDSELNYVSSDYSSQDTLYAQAATQGQSIFISSGDSGSDVNDQNTGGTATSGINVNAFGSPLVTVAGGTDFSDYYDSQEGGPAESIYWSSTNTTHYGSALGYIPETAWNESCASSILAVYSGYTGTGLCATGNFTDGWVVGGSGGISTHYAVPAWQTGISGYSNSNHAQPDIAGFASAGFWGHALIFCDSNPIDASMSGCTSEANFAEAGGTSFVAPYMAGVAGLLRDYTGSRQGLLNPALYALAKAQYTAAATKTVCYSNGQTSNIGVTTGLPASACIFNDVTTSNNDVPCAAGSTSCFVNSGDSFGMLSLTGSSSLTVAYPSTIGFDEVTGLGTVNVHNLITEWNTAFTSTTGLKASPTSITPSQSTVLTATVTGGTPIGYVDTPPALTGKASFAAGSISLGNCTLSAGTCSLSVPGTALKSGANSVTATFLGSGTYPTSTSSIVTVTVTASSGPTVTLTPTSLNFGTVATGVTSPAKTVTLKNSGNASLTITAIALTGTNSGDFPETTTCTSSLAAGASCTIKVQFKPSAIGARSAAVSITDNAAGSPQQVPLSGTGTTAEITPSSLSFGTLAVGLTSVVKTVTLKNLGTTAITITSIAVTGAEAGDFPKTATSCGSSLAAAASCAVSVTFKPTTTGARSANLTFTDNASGSPQQVPLSGTGTTAELTPTSLSFGTLAVGLTSAVKTVTLKNVGTTAITITSIAVTGAEAGDFPKTATSCGSSLAVAASCTVSVTFKPTTTGARSANLTFTDSAAGSPQQVPLSGTGTTAEITPTSVSFGSVTVGTISAAKTVTLKNVGTTAITITSVTIAGTDPGDFGQTNPCGSSLAAGASCTISVTFKPIVTGNRSATLKVTDNAAGSPQQVSSSGTGS